MGDVIRLVTRREAQEIARHLAAEAVKEFDRRLPVAIVNGYDIIAVRKAHGCIFLVHGHSGDRAFLKREDAEAFANQQPRRER